MSTLEFPDEIGDPDADKITEIVQRHCMGFTREEIRQMVMKAIQERAQCAGTVLRDEYQDTA